MTNFPPTGIPPTGIPPTGIPLIHCEPFSARISRAACDANLKTALRTAEKILSWRPATTTWRFFVPGLDDIALSRFAGCSRCAKLAADRHTADRHTADRHTAGPNSRGYDDHDAGTLALARERLTSMCVRGFAAAQTILHDEGPSMFDGHDHGGRTCFPLELNF